MATYEQLCGCVVEIEKGETRVTHLCDKHGPLSFGGAWRDQLNRAEDARVTDLISEARSADPQRHTSPFGVDTKGKSLLGMLGDRLFGEAVRRVSMQPADVRGFPQRPPNIPNKLFADTDSHSHTLCDEQVDFLNLTLSRERTELLEERRKWVMLRSKDRAAGLNRITEIDAELAMIDGITLKLRRHV